MRPSQLSSHVRVCRILLRKQGNTMSRGASTFRQRDLKAAILAVHSAGKTVNSASIDKEGRIQLQIGPDSRITDPGGKHGEGDNDEWKVV